MKKYLIATILIASFSAPVLAGGTFYIMFDTKTKTCSMMKSIPAGSRYKMLGSYESKKKAHAAMAGMRKCG
jgi:hypothetical protein